MSERNKMISRRRAFSLLGLSLLSLALPAELLTASDAEAGGTSGTERRQERRTGRTERRTKQRTGRTERRQKRRTSRTERRTKRRSTRTERRTKRRGGGEAKQQ
jgi:hypothetical protein